MNTRRVLIVDDDPEASGMLREQLESIGGYEVREEHLGRRALDRVHEFKPDVVLLDVLIPDLDGSVIAGEIEKEPSPRARVVFVTSLVKPDEAARGDIGGYPFLSKDSTAAEIRRCLDNLAA